MKIVFLNVRLIFVRFVLFTKVHILVMAVFSVISLTPEQVVLMDLKPHYFNQSRLDEIISDQPDVTNNVLLLRPDQESPTGHSRSVLVTLASCFLMAPF